MAAERASRTSGRSTCVRAGMTWTRRNSRKLPHRTPLPGARFPPTHTNGRRHPLEMPHPIAGEEPASQSAKDSVMVRMPCGLERAKNRRDGTPGNPFPLKHLPDSGIVCAAYHALCHFDGKMQIANLPGKNRRLNRIAAQLDFQNGLRGLRDHIAFSGSSVKNASVDQNVIEVETELLSILRRTSPAPLWPAWHDPPSDGRPSRLHAADIPEPSK